MSLLSKVVNAIFPPNYDMNPSKNCFEIIKKFEGLKLHSYPDEGGIWTIGWGTTKGVREGMRITLQTAEAWLLRDVSEAVQAVRFDTFVPLTQNQFDALVSFTYNVGAQQLHISTLRRLLNKGDYQSVPAQMARWTKVKVKGAYKNSNGLVTRRKLEGELFARS